MTNDYSKSDLQLKLARSIIGLFRRKAMEVGTHLREVELSDEFDVSRTPIRAALAFLASKKLVEKRENRGFFLIAGEDQCEKFLEDLPQTEDEAICEMIAKDWFEGKIAREVSEGQIRKRYGLGRLTTQRILNILGDDGIISRQLGYGWQFEPTLNSSGAHDESYEFRIFLETSSILSKRFEYRPSIGEQFLRRHDLILKQEKTEWNIAEVVRLDVEFHDFLAECSHNRFVIQSISQQNRLRRLLEYNSLIDTDRLKESCVEHIGILDCLQQGDRSNAANLLRLHLEKAKESGPDFAVLDI